MASSCSSYFHSHRPKGHPMSLCCIHQSAQIACKHTVMHLLSNTKKKQLGTKSPCQFLCTNSVWRAKQTAAVLMSTFGSVPTEMNFGQEQRRRWWPVCGHPSWTTHLRRHHGARSPFIITRRPDCLGFQNGPKEESGTLRYTFSWLQSQAGIDAQWCWCCSVKAVSSAEYKKSFFSYNNWSAENYYATLQCSQLLLMSAAMTNHLVGLEIEIAWSLHEEHFAC